ncbi:MAG: sigma-54-dependent Fis family transcriptional regulator [Thiotrichaceae bacterium]|nr:sigma-54-dependent Fis family transcriptional regulator [Thiotrichaceae bacterium]
MMKAQNTIYGRSPAIQEALRITQLIAATDVTTLIIGDTGTGKELFAKKIHQDSPRRNNQYFAINCAALPETLIESSLFGHKKGAFTDAKENHNGIIAQAHKSTLFLDGINETPLKVQSKLLRFLENGECQGIGYTEAHQYDVRIIAASNKNLRNEVKEGRFREDLYYRLNIVPLELPALKDRVGDVKRLTQLFFQDLVKQYELAPPTLTSKAEQVLSHYSWPGNIRELRNFCERMLILFSGKIIDTHNLPKDIRLDNNKHTGFFTLPSQGIKLEQLEINLYQQAIHNTNGNKTAAATLLGMTRDAFLYRLRKYNLR